MRQHLSRVRVDFPNKLKQLWHSEPGKRPTSSKLYDVLFRWNNEIISKKKTKFYQQFKEIEKGKFNKKQLSISTNLIYRVHSRAIYTSRLLDFKNLPEPQNSKEINDLFYRTKQFDLDIVSTEEINEFNREQTEQRLQAQIQIPPKNKFEKYLEKIEDPNNHEGVNYDLPESPTPLQISKFKLCKKMLAYQLETNSSDKEIADRIDLSVAETRDILFCCIEKFTLDRLLTYVNTITKELILKMLEKMDKQILKPLEYYEEQVSQSKQEERELVSSSQEQEQSI
ncbi:19046_t:CDS:2, partial [Racocetra fulgida]